MPSLPRTSVFGELSYPPRREMTNQLHTLADILSIATCVVIGVAESWEAIAEHGRTQVDFFRQFLTSENGSRRA